MTPQAKFNELFDKRNPGMSRQTETYRDAFDWWYSGYVAATEFWLDRMKAPKEPVSEYVEAIRRR